MAIATAADASRSDLRRLCILLFLLFGVSFAYFTQGTRTTNVMCRAALNANLVQHGRVDINAYEQLTLDKAFYKGNYYCDKAPGMTFLAAPITFAFTRIFLITAETASNPDDRVWAIFVYLCALTTSGLFSAMAAVVLFRYLFERTGSLQAAIVGSVTFGLGTPVWGWATSFFGHATAAAFLVMGFIALESASRRVKAGERAFAPAVLGGLALGAATAVEYTSFVPCAIIGAGIAATSPWRTHPQRMVGIFAIAGFGALCAIAPVLVYHHAAFGSAWTPGYRYTSEFDGMHAGFFGIRAPSLAVLGELVFGVRRGILWISPVIFAAVWAVVVAARRPETRAPAIVAAVVLGWYLVLNSGFSYWWGGYSTGPRYLTPALGIMALPLGLAWPHFGVWERRSTLALLGISVLLNLVCTAVDMTSPDPPNPLTEYIFPNLIDGQLRQTLTFRIAKVPGLLNLAPLLALWVLLGWLLWREVSALERVDQASPAPSSRGSMPKQPGSV